MNADKLVERAEAEASRRNWDGALVYFHQALTVDPGHRGARVGARQAALKKHERSYPSGMGRALSGMGPRMGMAFAGLSRDPLKRMEALEKALAADPRNADLGLKLAAACEDAKLPSAAAAACEGVLLSDPANTAALKALGRNLRALGDVPGALEALERAVKADPRDQEAVRLRKDLAAEGYARDAGFASARTTHDLLRDKDQARKLEQAQRIGGSSDDLEARARDARAKAAAAPSDGRAQTELGDAEASLRRYPEAEAAFARACELAPDDAGARVRLAEVRIAAAERAALEARKAADAGNAAAAGRVAALEARLLEVRLAETQARVRLFPTDSTLRYALAGFLEQAGRYDEAVAEYQGAVKDARRRSDALAGLGRCFLAKGLVDLATKQFEKALEEATVGSERHKSVLYDLATAMEKQGEAAKARQFLHRILEVDIGFRDAATRAERLGAADR